MAKVIWLMGIQDINVLLKKLVPEAYKKIEMRRFRGTRIAVDGNLWGTAALTSAFKSVIEREISNDQLLLENPFSEVLIAKIRNNVLERAKKFIHEWTRHDVTPVFVFDGESVPEKNSYARARRKEKRIATLKRIEEVREHIISIADPLMRSAADFSTLRDLHKQLPPIDPANNIPWIYEAIGKSYPVLKAPDEAEKYCAFLVKSGFASAVWTTDTDSFALGAPMFITGFDEDTATVITEEEGFYSGNYGRRYTMVNAVVPPEVLRKLGISQRQLTDLCILLGCDFNSRIPKFGPASVWKTFSSVVANRNPESVIEWMATEHPEKDWSVINAERCREIFGDFSACSEKFSEVDVEAITIPGVLAPRVVEFHK